MIAVFKLNILPMLALAQLVQAATPVQPDTSMTLTRIAFGSCSFQSVPQPVYRTIVGSKPDLYVSLGEPVGGEDWALRLYYKPMVRWIWLGSIFMAIGGIVSVSDRRYRPMRRKKEQPLESAAAVAT